MIKNLIFDLDGTLLDTLPAITKAANLTLKHFKKNYQLPTKEVVNYIGYGTYYLLKNCFRDDLKDDFDEVYKYYVSKQVLTHKIAKPYPYLKSSLISLKKKGYKLFVATNKPNEVANSSLLRVYGKTFFIDIEAQKKDTPKKPDPYVVNQIISRNKLNRKECIYIGDHECDIKTAINAKIPCIILQYGYGHYSDPIFKKCKKVINSPKEIINYLK